MAAAKEPVAEMAGDFRMLSYDLIVTDPGLNPRTRFDQAKLVELADSIRAVGRIVEPLVVRPFDDGTFGIVAGERRYRAAALAGLDVLPCLVQDLTDAEALDIALVENTNRVDVHPVDEARAYRRRQELTRGLTVAQIGAKIGLSESHVYRRLKLLDLDPRLLDALYEDRLSIGHAEKLMRLPLALQQDAAGFQDDTGQPEVDGYSSVVWARNPLLTYDEEDDWVPSRDDLQPLTKLEAFIRRRSHFDPKADDLRHFQPELAAQLDDEAGADDDHDGEDHPAASAVELSEDPKARQTLGAVKGEVVPLPPNRWREITKASERCEFAQRGVVTHGGRPRVLEVCISRKCKTHFPPAPPATKSSSSGKADKGETWTQRYARENAEREAKERAWEELWAKVRPVFVAHMQGLKLKFNAALVAHVLQNPYELMRVNKVAVEFGVKLADATAPLVLALSAVKFDDRDDFLASVKVWKFDLKKVEAPAKAAPAKKAAAKKPAAKKAAKGKKR